MEKDEVPRKRRPKGSGSVTRKANGRYAGRISIEGYEPYSCTGATKDEVEKKLEAFRIHALKQEVVPQRIFVNDYIEDWLKNVKMPLLKPSSYDRLEGTYKRQIAKSAVGRCQLGNITSMDVQRLINEKSKTLSYSTLKKVYGLLKECFDYAVAVKDMNSNPMTLVKLPKEENMSKHTKQMQVFSEEELKRIEKTADITYASGEPRYKHAWLFILMANTGLRAGEAIALTWENVDFENRMIYVKQNASCVQDRNGMSGSKYKTIITTVKTRSGNRTIPCNEKTMEALYWLKNYQQMHHIKSTYVDCNDKGEILSQKTLPKILKAILKAADVEYKSVHSFRHTFATNLIRAGVDVKVVSQLLGHSSVKITYDTYVHMGLESAIEAVSQLDKK